MRISDWSSDVCSSDLSKYILLDGLSNIRFMEDCAPDFGDADNSYAADPKIAGWQKILDQHYQRLIALAEQGQARADRSAKGWDMLVRTPEAFRDRESVVEGKSVSVREDLVGRRVIKKKKK